MIKRGAVLRIAGRCSGVVMSQRVTGGMAVQGMRTGGLCFGTLRLTGWVESCRPQAHIRIEPEAHHGDQHNCDVPAPANLRLLRLL